MLKYSELESVFGASGITVEEYNIETDEEVEIPYVAYVVSDADSFGADGVNYLKLLNVNLVMIDEKLNYSLQNDIEAVLTSNALSFNKTINFDEQNRLYQVSFFFNVMDA